MSDGHAGLRRAVERCLACSGNAAASTWCATCSRTCRRRARNWWPPRCGPPSPKRDRPRRSPSGGRSLAGFAAPFRRSSHSCRRGGSGRLAYMARPKEFWPMLASNNGLERLNRELTNRADVVQIFPQRRASCASWARFSWSSTTSGRRPEGRSAQRLSLAKRPKTTLFAPEEHAGSMTARGTGTSYTSRCTCALRTPDDPEES